MRRNGLTFIGLSAIIVMSGGFVIWPNYATGNGIAVIDYPSTPSLYNLAGERITSVQVGQQAVIRLSIHVNNPTEQSFVLIVEVRDGDGVTEYLAWQSGVVEPNGNYTMETLWTPHAYCGLPNNACNDYEIRSFALTSLESTVVLSAVSDFDGIRVTGSPPIPQSPSHYNLLLNNQTFHIEYSFSVGQGKITQIDVGSETEDMVLKLITPRNSKLTIYLPQELMEYVFPNTLTTGLELGVFVDEMPVDMVQTIDNRTRSFVFVIPLEQGSEQVHLVGDWII